MRVRLCACSIQSTTFGVNREEIDTLKGLLGIETMVEILHCYRVNEIDGCGGSDGNCSPHVGAILGLI